MTPAIGFVLLTHRDPGQILRLIDRLRRLYGAATPIVVHHDQGQCALAPPEGAALVTPHLATRWGHWSLVEATLAALRQLHAGPEGPELTVLLSGADYPVAPAERVLAELSAGGADAYLAARPITPWRRDRVAPGPLGLAVGEGAVNQTTCFRRYYSTTFRWRGLRFRLRNPLLAPLLAPFSRRRRLYAGDQWCVLRRSAVEVLLASPRQQPDLFAWFSKRDYPDEAYVQTVLANTPALRLDPRTFRYVDWSIPGKNPRVLGLDDVPRITASGAHFARKFRPDDPALDALDALLGLPRWPAPGALRDGTAG